MDHLPSANYGIALPAVPFYCDPTIDWSCTFSKCPSHQGFDADDFMRLDFTARGTRAREEVTSFLQGWLYFGLMSNVVGQPVDPHEFLDLSGEHPKLTSREPLPRYIAAWLKRTTVRDIDGQRKILEQARTYVKLLMGLGEHAESSPLPAPVLLSIIVLGATLETALADAFSVFPPPNSPFMSDWGSCQFLTGQLVQRGWCPSDAKRLYDNLSIPAVLFASTIPRREVIPQDAHRKCTLDGCIARTIDPATYRTKHVCGNPSTCGVVASPLEDVMKVLDDGNIPVIQIDPNQRYSLAVSSNRKSKYVAISHVWSDGLGCQDQNQLPSCQVKRLWKLCSQFGLNDQHPSWFSRFKLGQSIGEREASPTVALWIDTLCVPRPKEYRRLAISRMNETYANASRVLVLDSEMMSLPNDLPAHEVLIRLHGTSWMRRVWTMQEGALGSQGLHVQLGNGALQINGAIAIARSKAEKESPATSIVSRDATLFFSCYENLWRAFKYRNTMERTHDAALHAALRALNGRTTTNDGDAYLCLAGMIGLGSAVIKELAATPVAERTRVMMKHIQDVPAGIIFSRGPKLQDTGYRWVCASFWQTEPPYGHERAAPTGHGLYISSQGFVLDTLLLPREHLVFHYPHAGHWYKATYDPASSASILLHEGALVPRKYGIIVPDREVIRKGSRGSTSPAALVAIAGPPGGKKWNQGWKHPDRWGPMDIFCDYVCQVTLSGYDSKERPRAGDVGKAYRPNGAADKPDRVYCKPQIWLIS